MNFKNFHEAFDKPYKWEIDPDSVASLGFIADADDYTLEVYFWKNDADIEITFAVDDLERLTGNGNAFRIFATVKDIIFANIKYLKYSKSVYFSAEKKEKSRVKLYKLLAPKLKKKLKKKHLVLSETPGLVIFTISDKD